MAILYHSRRRLDAHAEADLEATYWESLDQMLARMDIVSVNCPHTPATYHLLSARRLKLLQPHAVLINTARGETIDEAALIDLLMEGRIGGAGLDVFESEPMPDNYPLLSCQRVVLTPHVADQTPEGMEILNGGAVDNVIAYLNGKPQNIVP